MLNTEATYFTAVIVAESADEEKRSFLLVGQKISTNGKQAGILFINRELFP